MAKKPIAIRESRNGTKPHIRMIEDTSTKNANTQKFTKKALTKNKDYENAKNYWSKIKETKQISFLLNSPNLSLFVSENKELWDVWINENYNKDSKRNDYSYKLEFLFAHFDEIKNSIVDNIGKMTYPESNYFDKLIQGDMDMIFGNEKMDEKWIKSLIESNMINNDEGKHNVSDDEVKTEEEKLKLEIEKNREFINERMNEIKNTDNIRSEVRNLLEEYYENISQDDKWVYVWENELETEVAESAESRNYSRMTLFS